MRETLPSAVGYKNACSMPWSSNSRSQSCALGALGNVHGSGGKVCWRARSQGSDAVSGPPRLLNGDFRYFRNSSVRSMICPSASITFDPAIIHLVLLSKSRQEAHRLTYTEKFPIASFQHGVLESRLTWTSPDASLRVWIPAIHAGMTENSFSGSARA